MENVRGGGFKGIEKRKVQAKKAPASEKIALAEEMYEAYNKTVRFPAILKLINEKGVVWSRETFYELKKQGIINWRYFCGCAKNVKIDYK